MPTRLFVLLYLLHEVNIMTILKHTASWHHLHHVDSRPDIAKSLIISRFPFFVVSCLQTGGASDKC
jgi:hypothetical protein